jgi:hypothetical protein
MFIERCLHNKNYRERGSTQACEYANCIVLHVVLILDRRVLCGFVVAADLSRSPLLVAQPQLDDHTVRIDESSAFHSCGLFCSRVTILRACLPNVPLG